MFVSVCLSAHITQKPRGQTLPIFVYVACGRGSVLLWHWQHCDILSTSGFVDNVMSSHFGPIARYAYSQAAIEHDKNSSRDSNQILLIDKDRKYLSVSCTPGAKSAIYDCFVYITTCIVYVTERPIRSSARKWFVRRRTTALRCGWHLLFNRTDTWQHNSHVIHQRAALSASVNDYLCRPLSRQKAPPWRRCHFVHIRLCCGHGQFLHLEFCWS